MRLLRSAPLHLPILAAFPVVALFAANDRLVGLSVLAWPLLIVAGFTSVLFAAAFLVWRDVQRAAIATAVVMLTALTFGHVAQLVDGAPVVGEAVVIVVAWSVIVAGCVYVVAKLRALDEATSILNALAVGLLAVAVAGLLSGSVDVADADEPRLAAERVREASGQQPRAFPDIYYLVFDRYARADVLDDRFGLDNSPFLDDLRGHGFQVLDGARSNYPQTSYSLASSLNLRYLDELAERPGPDSSDRTAVRRLVVDHALGHFLREIGYRHVHIGSWWDGTAHDPSADENVRHSRRSEFSRALLASTVLEPLAEVVPLPLVPDDRRVLHDEVSFQLDRIATAADGDRPVFVFAHVLMPHEPFTFDADGSYLDADQEASRSFVANYTGQVQFLNDALLDVVASILDRPGPEPIIVLQSDEGPHPFTGGFEPGELVIPAYGGRVDWPDASDDDLRVKFAILNAIYAPRLESGDLTASSTPVNTFRVLLRRYFGVDLATLPDRSYVFENARELYRFTDVTDRVEAGAEERSDGPPD